MSVLPESRERPATPFVSVEDVYHGFGDVTVLEDVTFHVERGSVTALVGPNGSGKTTLLRIVAGLLTPDTGTVRLTADGSRPVGYLAQSPSFHPAFTVEETLAFYASLVDDRDVNGSVDVAAALELVGLAGVRDRRVDGLSGGMTRLLGIAQAVLGDPPIVVLDEPTSDLDPRMTEYVYDVIADLAADGTAVIHATHDLTSAESADRIAILDGGTIVATGTPAEFAEMDGANSLREAFLAHTAGDWELRPIGPEGMRSR